MNELYKAGWPSELYLHISTAIAKANRVLITAMASSQLIRAMVPPNLPAVIGGGKHQFLQKKGGKGNYNQLDAQSIAMLYFKMEIDATIYCDPD